MHQAAEQRAVSDSETERRVPCLKYPAAHSTSSSALPETLGSYAAELFDGTGIDAAIARDPEKRVDWEPYLQVVERVCERAGGLSAIEAAGAALTDLAARVLGGAPGWLLCQPASVLPTRRELVLQEPLHHPRDRGRGPQRRLTRGANPSSRARIASRTPSPT